MKKILQRAVALVSAAAVVISTGGGYVQAAPAETEKPIYQVTIEDCVHGTMSLNKTDGSYEEGEKVEVTAVPDPEYGTAEIKVTVSGNEKTDIPVQKTDQGAAFEMPAGDVAVRGTFLSRQAETETGPGIEGTVTEETGTKTEMETEIPAESNTAAAEVQSETQTKAAPEEADEKETKASEKAFTADRPEQAGLKGQTDGMDLRTTNTVAIQVENNRLDWFKASGAGWFSQTKPQIVFYNNGAAFPDGMVNKSSFCLYSSKHSPEGDYHPGSSKFLGAAINYVLYYGNRAYLETAYDPRYSTGDYYKDYYITSMAIHYLNGELGNEPLMDISDAHIASLNDPVASDMYQKYRLLIADAKKAAAGGHDILDNAGRVSNAVYTIDGAVTQNQWKTDIENGGYRTKNNYKVTVSDIYAFDSIQGIKPVNAATGETEPGTSIKFVNSKIDSDFYIHVTDVAYQRMQKNQTKLKAVITGTTHTLSGTRYDPENAASISGDPLQPVVFMEWDTTKTDVKLTTVYAEPPKQENGKVKVRKVSANPAMTDRNNCYSVAGAEYKLTSDATGMEVAERLVTDASGDSQELTVPAGDYTMKESKAPKGFKLSEETFSVKVVSGKTNNIRIANVPANDPVGVVLQKIDQETGKPVATGASTFENAEYTFRYYDGQYKTEAELNGITPIRTWVLKTNEYGIIQLRTAEIVSGDEFYLNTEGQRAFPLGTVTIQESKAPAGYRLDPTLYIQNIEADLTGAIINSPQAPNSPEPSIRGGVQIEKHDLEINDQTPQGDATLAEAIFDIYNRSKNPVTVNGTVFQKDEVVHTFKTDASWTAKTAADLLQYGDYEIIEREAPAGYLNTGKLQQSFRIREHGKIVELAGDQAVKNNPIRGGVQIEKWDKETDEGKAQGNATLEGTVIQIINKSKMQVMVEGKLYQPEAVVKTVETNKDGIYTSADDLLPYGTYEAAEVAPPAGYLPTGELKQLFEIRKDREIVVLTGKKAIKNEPVRGDLKGIKVSDGDLNRMAGVLFKLTSETTKESHILVSDENGMFSTASDWVPHSQNTNRGETAEDGIWFGSIDALDDEKGALLYDTYLFEELPCKANADKVLLKPFKIVIKRNMTVIDLGTITNDYKPKPEIGTTATDQETGTHIGYVNKKTTLVDVVAYVNLIPGVEQLIKGIVMDPLTKKPLLVNGKEVHAEKTFVPEKESGTVELSFTFDSSALEGKEVVIFESLYQEGREIAVHADLKDKGQTVKFVGPKIGTTAVDKETGGHQGAPNGKTTIVDTVAYSGVIPGVEQLVKGIVMDKLTKKPLLINGKEVHAEKTFIPEKESGTVELEFTFDSSALAGKEVVIFESLYYKGREIAVHADLKDKGQTVKFIEPKIGTTAVDKETGKHEGYVNEKTTIVDLVEYTDLIVGKTYIVDGVVMDVLTGKPLLVNGKEVRAKKTFTAEKRNGSVSLEFTFDSSALKGKEVVVFESLSYEGREIASHADLKDKNQMVKFKEPDTPKTTNPPKTEPPKTTSPPKTGDTTNIILYVLALLGAAAVFGYGIYGIRRKRKQ